MHIQIQGLNKWFDDKHVLKDISFAVEEGEFVALLGPSGCGKTTLLNILAGFLDIDSGTLTVGGNRWSSESTVTPPEKRKVGMVFQDFALWPHMSVYDNIAFGLRLTKMPKKKLEARVVEVLDLVRMNDYRDAYPHQLSGGQKQRIAIARALAPSPSVMLMDEPLSSLDAKLREQMRWDLLDIIHRAGITTMYVTHDQSEALSMADRIVLLNEGHVEQIGTPTGLYHRPCSPFAAAFMGASNLLDGIVDTVKRDTVVVDSHGHMLQATGSGEPGDVKTVSIRPTDIKMTAPSQSALSVVPGGEHRQGAWVIYSSTGGTSKRTTMYGTIIQRAFHGSYWRYRVELSGSPKLMIEVWDEQEWELQGEVVLTVLAEKALVLDSTVSPENVARGL